MKIGFIAMIGVRVQNPELIALGLNLPGFVERSEVIASLPSLGLLTLAGMTPAHIDVAYLAEHADAVVVGEAEAVWGPPFSAASIRLWPGYRVKPISRVRSGSRSRTLPLSSAAQFRRLLGCAPRPSRVPALPSRRPPHAPCRSPAMAVQYSW